MGLRHVHHAFEVVSRPTPRPPDLGQDIVFESIEELRRAEARIKASREDRVGHRLDSFLVVLGKEIANDGNAGVGHR